MKTTFVAVLAMFLFLAQSPAARAALCAKCKQQGFITSIGTCKICQATTASGAFKLCKKCSEKLSQCEACQQDLKPKTEPVTNGTPPVEAIKSPGGKAYPAHWGAPPKMQTRDLRPLPGGYGNGSGTLAAWIQKNMDQDAKVATAPEQTKPAVGKAEEIRQIEKKIADMEELATRARFTAEGLKKHQAELAALRERLTELKGEAQPSGK